MLMIAVFARTTFELVALVVALVRHHASHVLLNVLKSTDLVAFEDNQQVSNSKHMYSH